MDEEDLLAYRVTQLEKRFEREERERKGRPMTIATIVMGVCALAQLGTGLLLYTGVLGK